MRMARLAFITALFCLALMSPAYAKAEKWQGVDDTVVGRCASEHGRPPGHGLINLEGDALLFAFLVAGAAGGFAAGYYYRDFMAKKNVEGKKDAG